MPLVDVQVIEGVFDDAQKQEMIKRVTDAMVSVDGESMRDVTWVRAIKVKSGQWRIAGNALTADAVRKMAAGHAG